MAALWYHYFLPLLVNSVVLDALFFLQQCCFRMGYSLWYKYSYMEGFAEACAVFQEVQPQKGSNY